MRICLSLSQPVFMQKDSNKKINLMNVSFEAVIRYGVKTISFDESHEFSISKSLHRSMNKLCRFWDLWQNRYEKYRSISSLIIIIMTA